MITKLGKFLRIFRMERGLLLKQMADDLGVSSSFLSAIEHGKKELPKGFEEKILQTYHLDKAESEGLSDAILYSKSDINLNISNMNNNLKDIAISFSRKLDTLDDDTASKIMSLLNKHEEEK